MWTALHPVGRGRREGQGSEVWRTLRKLTGVNTTMRDLRHYFAVQCLMRGIPISVVSAWMGHSKVELTVKRMADSPARRANSGPGLRPGSAGGRDSPGALQALRRPVEPPPRKRKPPVPRWSRGFLLPCYFFGSTVFGFFGSAGIGIKHLCCSFSTA